MACGGWRDQRPYTGVGFVTGLISVGLGWKINRAQAVEMARANESAAKANKGVADAGVEIAKAKEGAAQAVRDTAKANEEVARLNDESLQTQFNLEKTKTSLLEARANVFDLQRAAADAKAAQQRVEIDLAKQRQRAVKAEKDLLELQAQVQPRNLTPEQQTLIAASCRAFAGRKIEVRSYSTDLEGWRLGQLLKAAFEFGGLEVADETANFMEFGGFTVGVIVRGPADQSDLIQTVQESLSRNGNIMISHQPTMPLPNETTRVVVLVGIKPFVAIRR